MVQLYKRILVFNWGGMSTYSTGALCSLPYALCTNVLSPQ